MNSHLTFRHGLQLGLVLGSFAAFGAFVGLFYLAGVFPEPVAWPM